MRFKALICVLQFAVVNEPQRILLDFEWEKLRDMFIDSLMGEMGAMDDILNDILGYTGHQNHTDERPASSVPFLGCQAQYLSVWFAWKWACVCVILEAFYFWTLLSYLTDDMVFKISDLSNVYPTKPSEN